MSGLLRQPRAEHAGTRSTNALPPKSSSGKHGQTAGAALRLRRGLPPQMRRAFCSTADERKFGHRAAAANVPELAATRSSSARPASRRRRSSGCKSGGDHHPQLPAHVLAFQIDRAE